MQPSEVLAEMLPRPRKQYPNIAEKLSAYTKHRGPQECWLWEGNTHLPSGPKGSAYGRLRFGGKLLYAHRETYKAFVGDIPDGLTIDHICFNTRCVNPAHLEAVTQVENSRRYMVNKHWPTRWDRDAVDAPSRDRAIRAAYVRGVITQAEVAQRFGVSRQTVLRAIHDGRTR